MDRAKLVLDVIKRRRSVRTFTGRILSRDILQELVEAGVYAPSGSNSQNQRFLVINDSDEINAIGAQRWVLPYRTSADEASRRKLKPYGILEGAGALILVFSDNSKTDPRSLGEYHIWKKLEVQNCSASIQNILLLATAKGIGTVWVSCSDEMNLTRMLSGGYWQKLLHAYDIPNHYSIQGMVVLGYPKHIDDDGFPVGERKHGVVWSETTRGAVESYLIKKKDQESESGYGLSFREKVLLRGLSQAASMAVRFTQWCMHRVYSIERKIL